MLYWAFFRKYIWLWIVHVFWQRETSPWAMRFNLLFFFVFLGVLYLSLAQGNCHVSFYGNDIRFNSSSHDFYRHCKIALMQLVYVYFIWAYKFLPEFTTALVHLINTAGVTGSTLKTDVRFHSYSSVFVNQTFRLGDKQHLLQAVIAIALITLHFNLFPKRKRDDYVPDVQLWSAEWMGVYCLFLIALVSPCEQYLYRSTAANQNAQWVFLSEKKNLKVDLSWRQQP